MQSSQHFWIFFFLQTVPLNVKNNINYVQRVTVLLTLTAEEWNVFLIDSGWGRSHLRFVQSPRYSTQGKTVICKVFVSHSVKEITCNVNTANNPTKNTFVDWIILVVELLWFMEGTFGKVFSYLLLAPSFYIFYCIKWAKKKDTRIRNPEENIVKEQKIGGKTLGEKNIRLFIIHWNILQIKILFRPFEHLKKTQGYQPWYNFVALLDLPNSLSPNI